MSFYYHYQVKGGEDAWVLDLAEKRDEITRSVKPAFVTVLDLSSVPSDNDWTKVRYRGPLYFDFDAEGDLELACEQFKLFLLKLNDKLDFDIGQARLYLSGGKGMHIEIPSECFMPKVPPTGTPWLPYVYRQMAEALVVDTMDMRVYTGKRGRMWRTTNVLRENGNYKVSISLEEAMAMSPELYVELVKEPREQCVVTPPCLNSRMAVMFDNSREKVTTQMRGRKKRQATANAFLEPWKKAKKTPPTLEGLMDGSLVAEGTGFQALSMQLAIYATSVGLELDDFLDRCKGLCENHVSDSKRYNSFDKRREELARMWRYMDENNLYEFETGPIAKLVRPGVPVNDLGVMQTEDHGDAPAQAQVESSGDDSEPTPSTPDVDIHKGVRKGFFMNADGMWKRNGDITECLCRATLRKVDAFYDVEEQKFIGFEFDVVASGMKTFRTMLAAEAFASATALKRFFVNHQIGFQGGDFEAMSLMDVMAEKARRGGRVYVYPREGFMVINNPQVSSPVPVKVYLTQHEFISSIPEEDPSYFRLRYRPIHAVSSYCIDIHKAPELDESMKGALHDLFSFTRDDVAADLIGWFVACHYRALYLYLFNQFPLLQIYGEAGSGKSQTVWMLAHMHWFMNDISMMSSAASTPFAIDSQAASSTSAPFILDEFKPRELKAQGKGKYEKLKDMFKASYIGGDIGNRGTVNKGAENTMGVIKHRATAPVVFMGEAIEMETAIIERCVTVNLTKTYQTKQRALAFDRLHSDGTALSSLGRDIVQMGFSIDIERMRTEVRQIQKEIEAGMPALDDENMKRAAPRMIFNRAIVIHGLRIAKAILANRFGTEFDAPMDTLLATKMGSMATAESSVVAISSMSEISKVMNRIAHMSRDKEQPHEMRPNHDYMVAEDWVELKVERAYDQYRRYCAVIHDTPLFDSVEAFIYALNSYSPVVDRICASSVLREDGSGERVVRMNLRKLAKEGVQSFRS